MMIRADGIVAAVFAGYAWGIALALARVVVRYPPWRKRKVAKSLDEFEQQYAERSGVTVEWLHEHNQFGIPCDCEEPSCEGWQMKHIKESDG